MYRLWGDTETGGLNPCKHAVLTLYFQITNEDFSFVDEIDLLIKPDVISADQFTKEALKVTGINLGEHLKNPNTLTYTQARIKILDFLNKYKIPKARTSYRLHGQNVSFDVNMLKFSGILPEEDYSKLIHHSVRDTLYFSQMLQEFGYLAEDQPLNLGALCEFFGVPPAAYHNAKADVQSTILLYRAMVECFKKDKNKALSGISDSILNVIEGR